MPSLRVLRGGAIVLALAVLADPVRGAPCDPSDPGCCVSDKTCDDGNVCNGQETCNKPAKRCEPAPAPAPNGTGCDDGNACTDGDTCQAGICSGGAERICTPSDACHLAGTCNPATGACSTPAAPDGTGCDDGSACTQADACQAGVCTGGAPVVCGAGPCETAGTCNPATGVCAAATPKANGTGCDDGNACTQADACQAGVCTGGAPVVCGAGPCETAGTCSPATGGCPPATPKPNGAVCDDGDACTRSDRCVAGMCVGGDPLRCDDGVACTEDRCAPEGCVFEVRDDLCADGACLAGVCRPEAVGADGRGCVVAPADDGAPCDDDGVACTADLCRAGTCAHEPVDARCPAPDECATALCFPGFPMADASGCTPGPRAPDGGECREDLDPCTDDRCRGGVCAHDNVPERRMCEPVDAVFQRALGLLDATAALEIGITGALGTSGAAADGPSSRQLLDEGVATLDADLGTIVRVLSGRAPAGDVGRTLAEQRARTALPLARGLVPTARGIVVVLKRARRSDEFDPEAARTVTGQARGVLKGTKALKRSLRKLLRTTRVFAR